MYVYTFIYIKIVFSIFILFTHVYIIYYIYLYNIYLVKYLASVIWF